MNTIHPLEPPDKRFAIWYGGQLEVLMVVRGSNDIECVVKERIVL